jgi:hypothetical protein
MVGLTKNIIEEKKQSLQVDVGEVQKALQALKQQETQQIALLNALQGAIQQCDVFLQDERLVGEQEELDDASSDVENNES